MKTYEPEAGKNIYHAAQAATALARKSSQDVEFLFNGVSLRTTPTSNPDDIAVIYHLKFQLAIASKKRH